MRTFLSVAAVVVLGLSVSAADSRTDCVNACNSQMRDRIKACDDAYKQDGNAAKRGECMAAARAQYNACVSGCK